MTHQSDPINLTLTFTPTASGATIRWEADVLGVRESTFITPYPGDDLALVMHALDVLQYPNYPVPWNAEQQQYFRFNAAHQQRLTTLGLWDAAGRVVADGQLRVGRALFRALNNAASATQALGTIRDHATASGTALALRLRFPATAIALAALPWELLWDTGPLPFLLSRGQLASCTRHLDLPQALPPPQPPGSVLRILALVPRAGLPADVRQAEQAARRHAWQPLLASGQAVLDEISPATPAAIVDALQGQPPDIIHFYGHGRSLRGVGALLLDTPDGGMQWLGVDRLLALFGGVRLVLLHACQSAMFSDDGTELGLLSGLAPALSAAGVPFVIGMQQTVRITAATRASSVIYRALVAGASLQHAVSQARQALYVEEADPCSWAVPTLYIRSHHMDAAYLIQPTPPPAHPTAPARTSQVIRARGRSQVREVDMQGGPGSAQQVVATDQSAVERARLHARHSSTQSISAEDESAVSDVSLDDQ